MPNSHSNGRSPEPIDSDAVPESSDSRSVPFYLDRDGQTPNVASDLFQGAMDAVLLVDSMGCILAGNEAAERLFGRSQEQFVGHEATLLLDCPDIRSKVHALFASIADAGETRRRRGWTRCRAFRSDGTTHPVEFFATPTLRSDPPSAVVYVREASRTPKEEQAALEQEQWFHITFDAAPIGLALISLEGHFLRVNNAVCRITGYSEDDLLGCTVGDITHPDDVELSVKQMQRLLSGEISFSEMEKRFQRKGGGVVWGFITTSLVRDPKGRPLYFVGQVQDITERKQAQQSLEESERKFRLFAENASDVLYRIRIHPTPAVEYLSPSVVRVSGYSPEVYYTNRELLFQVIHPEDRQHLYAYLADPEHYHMPPLLRCVHRDGHEYWLEQNLTAIRDESGCVVGVEGICRDMSAWVHERKALEESQGRLRAIYDNSQAAFLLTNDDGIFVEVNRAACALFGCDPDQLVGATIWDDIPAEDRDESKRLWAAFLVEGHQSGEYTFTRPDGTTIDVEYRAVANVTPGLHLSIHRDVTDRKRAEVATQRLAAIVESSGDAIIGIDLDGRVISWNDAAEHLYDYESGEVCGRPILDLIQPEAQQRFLDAYQQALHGRRTNNLDAVRRKKNGTSFQVSSTISPVRDSAGQVIGISKIVRDITERKQTEELLQRYRLLSMSTTDLILFFDVNGVILEANEAAVHAFGYSRGKLIGMNITRLESPETKLDRFFEDAMTRPITFESIVRRKNGETFPVEVNLHSIELNGQTLLAGVARDVSERKRYEDQLAQQAFYDSLTELPNRALFMNRLEHALICTSRRKDRVALLFLDLDRFKMVNDSKGHLAGDQLLVAVAGRLKNCMRIDDTIARIGGDEFTILLENVDDEGVAIRLAERILRKLQAPFQIHEQEVFVTASIGIAVSGSGDLSAEELLRRADMAMYEAKSAGKARYATYQSHLGAEAEEKLRFETELRRAIERNQFEVYFQPIILMENGRAIGVEALVRWNHPRFGLMPPDEFVPLQEQIGLIEPFTLWVLEQAMAVCLQWHDAGHFITVSVNLSPHNLHAPTFVSRVAELLKKTGLPPSYLKLEITESAVMVDPYQALEVLYQFSDMGIRLSIDDFGTGYSSLSYLKQLPVHEIKIDKSFVIGMDGNDDDDAAIVRATIDLGHNLRKRVVAEGVENGEVWNLLKVLGCDAAQGYHMARPMPSGDILAWLQESAEKDEMRRR